MKGQGRVRVGQSERAGQGRMKGQGRVGKGERIRSSVVPFKQRASAHLQ